MKKILYVAIFMLLGPASAFTQTHHFSFEIQNKKEIRKITRLISVDNVKNNIVYAYANDKEWVEFQKLGYKTTAISENRDALVINMADTTIDMANWDRYPTYKVYVQMMNDFATNYPDLCQLIKIGNGQVTDDNGVLLHELLVLKISDNVATHEAEPEFFYTSTMHGDETAGFPMMLQLADYLLSNYGTDDEVTNLVNNIEIYINPLANPDGTYYGGDNTVESARRYLANGTDPNRDFPDPNAGANAPYQAETQAMMDFASAHHFVMSANFHGGAEIYNHPWDTWTTATNAHADADWFIHLGENYVSTARQNNSSYMTDTNSSGVIEGGDWYIVEGGRQDYMNYEHHCKEITIELSHNKLLSSDLLPTYWTYNKQALLDFMNESLYGFNGKVTNTSNEPLDAKIEISGYDKYNSWVVTDPANGDYYRPIAPGTYEVTYSADGYISQTHTITVSDWKTTNIKNVVLEVSTPVNISGQITDASNGNPIDAATVELLNTSYSAVNTDASGNYLFNDIYEDDYQLKISKEGYTTKIINISVRADNTTFNETLNLSAPISFETGVPDDFQMSGDANWVIDNTQAPESGGTSSMKSGSITDYEKSTMSVTKTTEEGAVSFYHKISSEDDWDFLKFYIDDNLKGSWSGLSDWIQDSYAVSSGTHTFKWEYAKDEAVSENDDCARVDLIEFPPPASTDTNEHKAEFKLFPNPSNGTFTISYFEDIESVKIFDISGKLIKEKNELSKTTQLNMTQTGFYIVQIKTRNENFSRPLIITKP